MNVLHWLTDRFSHRRKALSLYKRGMTKANKHDHLGAIEDYSSTIDMSNTPADVKAMALYNRALAYSAGGDSARAMEDLHMVLTMGDGLTNIKTEARRKLMRMQRRSDDSDIQERES